LLIPEYVMGESPYCLPADFARAVDGNKFLIVQVFNRMTTLTKDFPVTSVARVILSVAVYVMHNNTISTFAALAC
jgi:hypothetical protein